MHWKAAILLIGCAVLNQGAAQNKAPPSKGKLAGYNQSARELKDQKWEGFGGVDFIYWRADEDGLSVGRRIPANRTGTAPTLEEKILLQKFSYKPGFKLFAGVGCSSFDNGKAWIKWTRLHQRTTARYAFDGTTEAVLLESWVHLFEDSFRASQVRSSWKLHFDVLDFLLSRPYYSGEKLVFEPMLGLRAAWIDQDLSIVYQFTNTTPMSGEFRSSSWGLGPFAGCLTNWKLGCGFALLGKASASLLYTSYTELKLFETIRRSNFAASGVNADYDPYRTVRPNAELGLGVKWGTHLYNRKYYLALSAIYDFNVFWHQNMLRGISDNYSFGGSEAGIGALNLHGLTMEGCFHF